VSPSKGVRLAAVILDDDASRSSHMIRYIQRASRELARGRGRLFKETLDHPGWWVSIDLEGADMSDKPFEPLEARRGEGADDWMSCTLAACTYNPTSAAAFSLKSEPSRI